MLWFHYVSINFLKINFIKNSVFITNKKILKLSFLDLLVDIKIWNNLKSSKFYVRLQIIFKFYFIENLKFYFLFKGYWSSHHLSFLRDVFIKKSIFILFNLTVCQKIRWLILLILSNFTIFLFKLIL